MATAPKTRSTYNPGEPGEVLRTGTLTYAVQSFRGEDAWYSVDLANGTCTCPHAQYRDPQGGCKHYRLALAAEADRAREIARTLSPRQLRRALDTHDFPPAVREAVQAVLFEQLRELLANAQARVNVCHYLAA